MSKFRFNPLITASVISAVCMAGIPGKSMAVDQTKTAFDGSSIHLTETVNNRSGGFIPTANAEGQQRYIIRFETAALARFNGNNRFSAIPRSEKGRLLSKSPEAQAYVQHLKEQQNQFLNTLSSTLNRNVAPLHTYQYGYNGMAVSLTSAEANQIKNIAHVADVILDRDYPLDTDAGPQLIGADSIWNGTPPASGTALGEGMVIGTFDTGINFDHPSFAETGGDNFVHTNPLGAGNFLGVCDSTNTSQFLATYTCNNKLIGGYDFVNNLIQAGETDIPGPEDENGHGSHTAGTSGGNVTTAEINGINNIPISGVAPHATVIIFDTCFNTAEGQGRCPGAASIASADQVIQDGIVDVVNFSIGGGALPWTDPVSEAFLNLVDSGVFVSASAGNSGPGPATLGHLEPWTASVGSSTHRRRFSNNLDITGPGTVPLNLTDILAIQGSGPVLAANLAGEIDYAGDVDAANVEGCNAFPANAFNGVIALISRGSCSFEDKVVNATNAGAIGVVVHNNAQGDPIPMGALENTTISSVMISQSNGQNIVNFIANNPTATVNINAQTVISMDGLPDSMARTSSRGPSTFEVNKPDVSAPGVSILAAFHDSDTGIGTPAEFGNISGTSMASPHNAGAAALLMELNPTWTPSEVKSALMMTAKTADVFKEDQITPADPFDRGAGRIQVAIASSTGLVMDETTINYENADPANGGDPKTLNVPSMTSYNCESSCSFQREFKSVASTAVDYAASLNSLPGSVTPSTFTLNPGQSITLDVEVTGASLPVGVHSFGELTITDVTNNVATSFSESPNVAIPDDGYDGTLGSMACQTIAVSGINSSFTLGLTTAIDHTWVGDLTIKVENPDGNILGVLSRPVSNETLDDGTDTDGAGDSSNLLATSPVSFADNASTAAEDMGAGLAASSDVICQDDNLCDYAPAPGSVANPPSTFAELMTGTVNGNWNVCVGDSASADTGTLVDVSLSFTEPAKPTLHLPMVIVGFPNTPHIEIQPGSLASTQNADTTANSGLIISNGSNATADLNWVFDDAITAPIGILEQVTTATNGIVSDLFTGSNGGVYSADDMTFSSPVSITTMRFEGFVGGGDTIGNVATSVSVFIYADNNGAPAGHPDDGQNNEVFSINLPINDPNLDLTDNNIVIDVQAANNGPVNIPAGSYWITAFPTLPAALGDSERWNWFAGTVDGNNALIIDPQNLFGANATNWTDIAGLTGTAALAGLNVTLSGVTDCGAPWVSGSPVGGMLVAGDSENTTVTFDSTGISAGVYNAALCVSSDDFRDPVVAVPVTMTVQGQSDLIFANGFEN